MRVLGKEFVYPVYILECEVCHTFLEYGVYDLHFKGINLYKPYITCPICSTKNEIGYDGDVIYDYRKLNNL